MAHTFRGMVMRKAALVPAAVATLLLAAASASQAQAMPLAPASAFAPAAGNTSLLDAVRYCRCERLWPHRQYWHWGHHPLPDDQWELPFGFWDTPEPPLVPADVW